MRSRSATPTTKATPLTEKDTVVLADFTNSTGDPVFDDALKQALGVQLGQSPFLNILSDRKVEETLHLMGRPSNRADHARCSARNFVFGQAARQSYWVRFRTSAAST